MNLIILILKLVIIIIILTIKPTFCNIWIEKRNNNNILQINNNNCPMNIKYWNLFKWYFNFIRTPFLVISKITDYPLTDHIEYNDDMNLFAAEMFNIIQNSLLIQNMDLNEDGVGGNVSLTDTYSWSGKKFKPRVKQQNERIKRDNLRNVKLHRKHRMTSNVNHGRTDEPEKGILVIANTLKIIDEYLTGTARKPFDVPRGNFILFISNENITDASEFNLKSTIILKKLWNEYGIINSLLITPCISNDLVYYLDPFEKIDNSLNNHSSTIVGVKEKLIVDNDDNNNDKKEDEEKWGTLKWFDIEHFHSTKSWLLKKTLHFNGYPLTFNVFIRYPTMLPSDLVPPIFLKSYYGNILNETHGYSGFDAIVLGNMVKLLKFRAILKQPQITDYGYKLDNGTFIGSLGDVLYSQTYGSFNGRFLTQYDTDEIEFMFPVFADSLCVICPKSEKIPQWMAIFRCFNGKVWSAIVIINTICGYVWYIFKRWSQNAIQNHFNKPQQTIKNTNNNYNNKLTIILIEMWIVMLAAPSTLMPYRTIERFLLCGCLVANVIIAGTFQGSLVKSFSTQSYYKDVNTLVDLDNSNFIIGTTSESITHLFDNDNSTLISSLRSKIALLKTAAILRATEQRDVCCVERYADHNVILSYPLYEHSDGTPKLHLVKECPRVYYLAYIVRKGWPLLPRFTNIINRFFEAGLLKKWYEVVESAIILNRRYNKTSRASIVNNVRIFTLLDMQTAFYILSIGLSCCIFIFLIEICMEKCSRNGIEK